MSFDPSRPRQPDGDADLDEAVEDTFPASDPIAPQSPATPTPDGRTSDEDHPRSVPSAGEVAVPATVGGDAEVGGDAREAS